MTDEDLIYWLLQDTSELPEVDNWLSRKERSLLEIMKFPKRRGEWRLGRWTAKRLLVSYFKRQGKGYRFSELEVLPSGSNAPIVFLHQDPLPLKISISHRSDVGFCALLPRNYPIGCDLEIIEPRSDNFIADYFTSKEYSRVMEASEQEQPFFANLIWSAKESILKALEEGLKSDTRSVEIDVSDIYVNDNWNELHGFSSQFDQEFFGWWKRNGEYVLTIFSAIPANEPSQIQI